MLLIPTSCEEDFQVDAEAEFIPVVYCLLNPEDSVQIVRVSRVFKDKRAGLPLEIQYDTYLADTLNAIYIDTFEAEGKTTTIPFKRIGQLENGPNPPVPDYLYSAVMRPGYGKDYQLNVYFPGISKMVSGKIRTLTRIELIDPAAVPGRKLVISPSQPYMIRWYSTKESVYFQGKVELNYLEEENGLIQAKAVEMPLRPVMITKSDVLNSQNISGMHFLQALRDQISIKSGVRRKMADIDFTFYYGGVELALFASSGYDPQGADGTAVDFSNLENGRGLFSSISQVRVTEIPLAEQTLDTIALHELTRHLNFLRSYEDFN